MRWASVLAVVIVAAVLFVPALALWHWALG